jgi:prepilin-type N-terminal cleavage/methylation domain-containing protein
MMKRLSRLSAKRQQGFTILELMIATTVFAVILLVAAAGILSFSHDYYRGVTTSNTQAAARAILNDISQNIQLSSSVQLNGNWMCINRTTQYAWHLGGPVAGALPNQHTMVRDTNSDCSAAINLNNPLTASQQEMPGEHMQIGALDITPLTMGVTPAYTIHVRLVFGEWDLLQVNGTPLTSGDANNTAFWASNGGKISCRSGIGSQYCAVSDLTTTVQVRLL